MVERSSMSVRRFLSLVVFAAAALTTAYIGLLALGIGVMSLLVSPAPSPSAPRAQQPAPSPGEEAQLVAGRYADVAADFDAAFLGPYVYRGLRFDQTKDGTITSQRVLFVAPGIRLSSQQEALAVTAYVDVSISADGRVSIMPDTNRKRPSPHDQLAASVAGYWRFEQTGTRRLSTVTHVPVRILNFDNGVSGMIDIPNASDCEAPKIQHSYQRYSWSSLVGQHRTEVTADGNIQFYGSRYTLLLDGHALVSPQAVRRSFKRVLSSDLLKAGANIGAWHATDSGHSGDFVFACGKRTLLRLAAEASDEKAAFDIGAEIETLAGIKRWTVGNDGTPGILGENSWQFHNLNVLRGVAQNGSAKGILALAARGMPMTEDEQKANSKTERVNALEIMAQRRETGSLRALLASSIRWSKSQLTDALFIVAGGPSDLAVVNALVKAGADPRGSYGTSGRTVLMAAAASGYADVVARILQFDSDVNRADKDGDRALHYVVESRTIFHVVRGRPGVWATADERVKALNLILKAGANVNAANLRRETAVMLASRHPGLVEALLKHGANPNARDSNGRTPLMRAEALDAVKSLLEHGADARAIGNHGETALNSLRIPDAVPLLIAAGGDVKLADKDGRTPLMMAARSESATRLLIARGADVNARDRFRQTVLMRCPSTAVAQILLEAGADPTLRDNRGKTASDHATAQYAPPQCKEAGEVISKWMRLHQLR
jgi:ankyrin repeat protein